MTLSPEVAVTLLIAMGLTIGVVLRVEALRRWWPEMSWGAVCACVVAIGLTLV
jgi:hypothetical protein